MTRQQSGTMKRRAALAAILSLICFTACVTALTLMETHDDYRAPQARVALIPNGLSMLSQQRATLHEARRSHEPFASRLEICFLASPGSVEEVELVGAATQRLAFRGAARQAPPPMGEAGPIREGDRVVNLQVPAVFTVIRRRGHFLDLESERGGLRMTVHEVAVRRLDGALPVPKDV